MKQKIKTINNKRLVKSDNPSELGKDELLVEVDNTTGKISLFEKDATGKVNQVAGGSSDDGPLPGAVEAGLEDALYYAYSDYSSSIPLTSNTANLKKIDLSKIQEDTIIVLEGIHLDDYYNMAACLKDTTPMDIYKKCYVKFISRGVVLEDGSYDDDAFISSSSNNWIIGNPGLVFSGESAQKTVYTLLEVRTPIKKHVIRINAPYNSIGPMLFNVVGICS